MPPSDADAWMDSLVGRTLARRYRLTRLLGAGGVGAVYEAEHLAMGRRVAVKVLFPELLERASVVERFHREARAAAACARAGVVEVLDLDSDPACGPFIAMELLEGETLADRLTRHGAMSPTEAAGLAAPVLETLAAVHARAIVHRDLKPGNIFLAQDGDGGEVVKVLDFGMARSPSGSSSQLTLPGSVLGTPRYMAPEQAIGDPGVDHRSDLFAVGAILYTCLAGRPPYSDVPAELALGAVLTGPPEPLARLRPSLPAALVALVERAMARDPMARFQRAEDMLSALLATLEPGATGSAPTLAITAVPHLADPAPASQPAVARAAGPASHAAITRDLAPSASRGSMPTRAEPRVGLQATVPIAVASPGGSPPGSLAPAQPLRGTPTPPPGLHRSDPSPAAPAPGRGGGVFVFAAVVAVLALVALGLAVVLVVVTRREHPAAATSLASTLPPPAPAPGAGPAGSAPPATAGGPTTQVPAAPPQPDIPAGLRALLDRARALAAAGRVDEARAVYLQVEQAVPAPADGSPEARARGLADLDVGDLELRDVTEVPPLRSASDVQPVLSRIEARGRALQRYAMAMRRGHVDLNVCGSLHMGRADERLAYVYTRVTAAHPSAELLARAYRDLAPRFQTTACDDFRTAVSMIQYSPACGAAARSALEQAQLRLAQMGGERR